jgi:hypothetical protein
MQPADAADEDEILDSCRLMLTSDSRQDDAHHPAPDQSDDRSPAAIAAPEPSPSERDLEQ